MPKGGMDILGDKRLAKTLATLGDKVARKVTRQAVNAAATPVLRTARDRVPQDDGTLKKSLAKKVATSKDKQTVSAIVGPRRDFEETIDGVVKKPSRYAHAVENGHIDPSGVHVPAQPFMRPAADENESKAQSIMADKLAKGIVREASR